MPEYILPYVIHLLAHQPDFPDSGAGNYPVQQKYLQFLLAELVGTLGQADNMAFLLQMLQCIRRCNDAVDVDCTAKIAILAEISGQLLKSMIRHQRNLKPFPGDIYLPLSLYCSRERDVSGDGDCGLNNSLLPDDFVVCKTPHKTPRRGRNTPGSKQRVATDGTAERDTERRLKAERPTRSTPTRRATRRTYAEVDSDESDNATKTNSPGFEPSPVVAPSGQNSFESAMSPALSSSSVDASPGVVAEGMRKRRHVSSVKKVSVRPKRRRRKR